MNVTELARLRRVELVQRAGGGGFPVANSDGVFDHGESVYVVSKRELIALFHAVRASPGSESLRRIIEDVLQEDDFVCRDGDSDGVDLPPLSTAGKLPPSLWYSEEL